MGEDGTVQMEEVAGTSTGDVVSLSMEVKGSKRVVKVERGRKRVAKSQEKKKVTKCNKMKKKIINIGIKATLLMPGEQYEPKSPCVVVPLGNLGRECTVLRSAVAAV